MDEFQLCVAPGCSTPAVKLQYWSRQRPPRNDHKRYPSDMCLTHHRERIAGDVVRVQVSGEARIVDVLTGMSVAAPGVVSLDPAKTFIPGLLSQGLVKQVEVKATRVPPAVKKSSDE